MEKIYIKPFDVNEGLNDIRLGKIKPGLGIGVPKFDQYVAWKERQMFCYGTSFVWLSCTIRKC